MAENSKIEWCDHTINFWWGCTKVSPACANCYAEAQDARFYCGQLSVEHGREVKLDPHWGPDAARLIRVEAARREAMRYERGAVKQGRRFRVFTNSMSDFFEDRRDLDGPRLQGLDVIRQTPHLDWLILTKRPENIDDLLWKAWSDACPGDLAVWLCDWRHGRAIPANVWLGTTVEDQERADHRIPALLQAPAAVRFLSCEPLLGPLDLTSLDAPGELDALRGTFDDGGLDTPIIRGPKLDWVICGGESGPHARPMHPDWARGLRDQCAAAGVPFLFKQWGQAVLLEQGPTQGVLPGAVKIHRLGKKAAGRLLDGVEHNDLPGEGR